MPGAWHGGGKVGAGRVLSLEGKPDVQKPAEERHALRPALGGGKDANATLHATRVRFLPQMSDQRKPKRPNGI